MNGVSYIGATQWLASIKAPKNLIAIMPVDTDSDYFEGWTYQGGAFQLGFILRWVLMGLAPDTLLKTP